MPKIVPVALVGATPIPIGHKVRVTYYESTEEGSSFFGNPTTKTASVEVPRVEDLTTGIVFGHLTHYEHGSIHVGRVNVEDLSLLGTLAVTNEIEGTVKKCTVISVGFEGRDVEHQETHLSVEVD